MHRSFMEVRVPPLSEWSSWDKDLLVNGCGPKEGIGRWYDVPDWVFEDACNEHDRGYIIGGPMDLEGGDSTWRHDVDLRWYEDMLELAWQQPWYCAWWYARMAWIYYQAVSAYGADYFVFRSHGQVVTMDMLKEEERVRQQRWNAPREVTKVACLRRWRESAA